MFKPRISVETIEMGKKPQCQVCIKIIGGRGKNGLFVQTLFNQNASAKVFRARFPAALNESGLSIPKRVPKQWIVDCAHVGKGITALKYLSRYLYRGVIREKNIVSNQNGQVTFRYTESKSGNTCFRTLKGEDFLSLIMQHVLPKGFRRVRDYVLILKPIYRLMDPYALEK